MLMMIIDVTEVKIIIAGCQDAGISSDFVRAGSRKLELPACWNYLHALKNAGIFRMPHFTMLTFPGTSSVLDL